VTVDAIPPAPGEPVSSVANQVVPRNHRSDPEVNWSAKSLSYLPSPLSEGGLRGGGKRPGPLAQEPPPTPPLQGGEFC
jgi:hypothetical protein